MATIRLKIANGYRPQVDAYVEGHPGIAREDAVRGWVDERYGGWIASNITGATGRFTFAQVNDQQFDVAFEDADHANQFQSALGGQVVADE